MAPNTSIHRGKRLINMSEIARRLDISRGYVSKIMNGTRKSPHYNERLEQLLKSEFGKSRNAA